MRPRCDVRLIINDVGNGALAVPITFGTVETVPYVFGLGDRIEIRVVSANKATMRLELEPTTAKKNRRENL